MRNEETNQKVTIIHGRDGGGVAWGRDSRDGDKMTDLIPNNLKTELIRPHIGVPGESETQE